MFAAATRKNTRRPANTGRLVSMPAASTGMNARDMYSAMKPTDAISLKNLMVEPYGLIVRGGTAEFAINIPSSGATTPIHSLLSYYPSTAGITLFNGHSSSLQSGPITNGKLFAATGGLIYNISAGGSGPWVPEVGIGMVGGTDDWTSWNFSNAGGNFLTVTNNITGGYYIYDGTTWTKVTEAVGSPAPAGQIFGVDPDDFVFHFPFKGRNYFIEKNSTRMWYLPPDQLTGDAQVWDFGAMFKRGGALQMISSWTQDAGESIDDYFVAVSSNGDVVIYKGFDPNNAPTDWTLVGIWYVGPLPYGYRVWTQAGGDTLILTQYGVVAVSAILQGRAEDQQIRITDKIDSLLGAYMRTNSTRRGWEIRHIPTQEMLLIDEPPGTASYPLKHKQFAYKMVTRGWSVFDGIESYCWTLHGNEVFHGRNDGKVMRTFTGSSDNVLLGNAAGDAISGQWITSFQPLGPKGTVKKFCMIRPTIVLRGNIDLRVAALSNYEQSKDTAGPAIPTVQYSYWDVDKWDSALWASPVHPIFAWLGVNGVGFVGAAQIDFTASGETTQFTQLDWWVVPGGPLA